MQFEHTQRAARTATAAKEFTMNAVLNAKIAQLPAWLRGIGQYGAIELLLPGGGSFDRRST